MARFVFKGRMRHAARSFMLLMGIGTRVTLQRMAGIALVPQWTRDMEIGNLFWRGQFERALAMNDINEGRAYFDSLQTYAHKPQTTQCEPSRPGEPRGDWFLPPTPKTEAVILYMHGGGYTFYADSTREFIAFLSAYLGARIFAPNYRMTPEHPHPAQIEDAMASYRFMLEQGTDPQKLVVAGDSAGGHLALMTLIEARKAGLPQPALGLCLCPWTDIAEHGASFYGNDRFDLVQGWMALKFGEWLRAGGFSNEELSPIHQDLRGVAPLYLQGGGKEVLIDMIRDFDQTVRNQGGKVTLDVWEHMTHNFQEYALSLPESREALARIAETVSLHTGGGLPQPGFNAMHSAS
jgi:epsilon-lactone hydrolase